MTSYSCVSDHYGSIELTSYLYCCVSCIVSGNDIVQSVSGHICEHNYDVTICITVQEKLMTSLFYL